MLQDAYEGRNSAADPQTNSSSNSNSSSSSSSAGAAAAEAAASDPAAAGWRLYVLKQKVELGSRSFEVQASLAITAAAAAAAAVLGDVATAAAA
ncbi:hypothetical protein Emed_005685 [Eimeria media]